MLLPTIASHCGSWDTQMATGAASIDVLVEAGSFAEGSGEAALVQDALSKIRQADSKIV